MKRSLSYLAYLTIAAMIVVVTLDSNGQTKKYDIKSCTITFEMTQKMAGLDLKNKVVLSFDDYGMKECRETYTGDKISEIYFSDGKDLYSLKPDKKTAMKRGPGVPGYRSQDRLERRFLRRQENRKGKTTSEHDDRRQDVRSVCRQLGRIVDDLCRLERCSDDA